MDGVKVYRVWGCREIYIMYVEPENISVIFSIHLPEYGLLFFFLGDILTENQTIKSCPFKFMYKFLFFYLIHAVKVNFIYKRDRLTIHRFIYIMLNVEPYNQLVLNISVHWSLNRWSADEFIFFFFWNAEEINKFVVVQVISFMFSEHFSNSLVSCLLHYTSSKSSIFCVISIVCYTLNT